MLGVGFMVFTISGYFGYVFYYLIDDVEGKEEALDCIKMTLFMAFFPFLFWYEFIRGNDPFKELNI